jgi:hypothetical protein
MAEKTQTLRSAAGEPGWGRQHRDIVEAEIAAINTRREQDRQVKYESSDKSLDVVGLTLSGGGIRSAAICLGVLQALNHYDLLKRIDYLSTVSGGGYIGSSLTATMTRARQFAFGKTLAAGPGAERAIEISDTPSVGHIRNYSNYLIPAGARDLLTGMAIVVRGLVANLSLTLPVVLLLAAMTVLSNPARSSLYVANFFGFDVGSGHLFSFLGDSWIVSTFGFTLAGLATAVLVLVGGLIHRLVSDVDRRDFVAYLAGTAFVLGVICNVARYLHMDHFALTLAAALLGIALFFIWALRRSRLPPDRLQEFRGHLPTMGATYLVLLGVIGFFEFQPFMIAEMFDVAEGGADQAAGVVGGVAIGWVKSLAAITAPVAAAVTLFRQQFADLLKGAAASDLTSRILAYVAKIAVWVAGLALPLLIWIGYLYLCYWGIANDKVLAAADRQSEVSKWDVAGMQPASANAPESLSGKIQFNSTAKTLSAEIGSTGEAKPPETKPVKVTSHIPGWLLSFSSLIGDPDAAHWSKTSFGNNVNWPMAVLYIVAAFVLLVISMVLRPNANSLHRLYRDRLSKAFLFNPKYYADGGPARNEPSLDQGHDFLPLDDEKLSKLLNPGYSPSEKMQLVSPYHLINTALNIQGSDFANRRGRNADFFVFSPLHVGSEATGYAGTAVFENAAPGLDLATAMAISGAAASSNMGSSSIRPLTPTLALLNVRLGYWLANPRYVHASSKPQHHSTPLYLWSEITGRLYENADAVYLTDGGHIENLGVYELLRRRCKVIIAVDAEADAPMNFSALMTLQRYARIDLGILIDLPWTPIRTRTLALMNSNAGKPPSPTPSSAPPSPTLAPPSSPSSPALVDLDGPHVAIGIIHYGGAEKGYLVYIKSSLTGDENDYIRDYARRYNSFPHESTGDQFFSEEQFEVYRALGFHMTNEFLSGDDKVVAAVDRKPPVTTKFSDTGVDSIKKVRAALGLPVAAPATPSGGVASR